MAIHLATTFTTETGGAVPPPPPRREPVPDSRFNIADPIGAVPGLDRMDPHPEGRAIYPPTVHGATGRTTETFLPILAGTGDPRGTDNHLGLHDTENRDPYRLCRRRAPGTHRIEAEYIRYSDAEDPRHRTDEDREERRWRYCDNREERHGRYRDAGWGGDPSDDEPSGSDDSRMRATGHAARGAEIDAGTTRPTRKNTRPSWMRSFVARADTAGLLRGAWSDGPR